MPWGHLELEAQVAFTPSASRQADDGSLLTVHHRFEISRLELQVAEISVNQVSGGQSLSFDPAAPPEGYSLCHGGHCHADDGSLVEYADIEAELNAGGQSGVGVTLAALDAAPLDALAGDALELEACEPCDLVRGSVSGAQARIVGLSLSGRVFDRDSGAEYELPDEGVAFVGTWALDVTRTAVLDEPIERGEPLGLNLAIAVGPGDTFLDDVSWVAALGAAAPDTVVDLSGDSAVAQALAGQLGAVQATPTRFEWTP